MDTFQSVLAMLNGKLSGCFEKRPIVENGVAENQSKQLGLLHMTKSAEERSQKFCTSAEKAAVSFSKILVC